MHFLEKLRPLSLLLLRLGLAVIFIYYGYPKLFGNARPIIALFASSGFPRYFVYLSGVLELFGGIVLILGIFTRITGLLLTAEMAMALWKVHHMFSDPRAVPNYQFALVCGLGAFALATFGAGAISLDQALFPEGSRSSSRKAKNRN